MILMISTYLASLVALIAVVAFVSLRGGQDEKRGLRALVVAFLGTQLVSTFEPSNQLQPGVLIIDIALTGAFLRIMLRSSKFWPIWAAAAQFAGTLTHFAALRSSLPAMLYATTQGFWLLPILVALLIGAIREPRRPPQRRRE